MKNPAAVAMGSIKSERKASTSAENGKKGGRPRKTHEYVANGPLDANGDDGDRSTIAIARDEFVDDYRNHRFITIMNKYDGLVAELVAALLEISNQKDQVYAAEDEKAAVIVCLDEQGNKLYTVEGNAADLSRKLTQAWIDLERMTRELNDKNTPCIWKYNAYECFYDSACGNTWFFEEGTAEENDCHYCHNCGHPVQIVMPETPPDEEEE